VTVFAAFADEPRWVAWRIELRGKPPNRKPTKVPYAAPRRKAEADNPSTWTTRAAAETCAAQIKNGRGGGVGIELGDLGTDVHIGGLDLDSCLDETQTCAAWAQAIIATTPTYGEISPSGTGLKLFFYLDNAHVRPFLDLIGIAPNSWGTKRGIPGEDERDHGPAVEVYLSHRFFAVTEQHWPGLPDRINLLDWEALQRLAARIPPPKAANSASSSNGKPADNSRSAAAFRKGAALRRNGATFEDMCAELRRDPETAAWCREKGDAAGGRELKRIWDKAGNQDGRPEITVAAGERHKAADAGIAALQAAGVAFYQRDRALVRVADIKARSTSGEVILVPGIAAVTPAILDRALGQAAHWQRFDPKKAKMVRIDPPGPVVAQILAMVGEWPFAPLAGVTGCPTLRPDGSLLSAEGYDPATGLVLRSAVQMPQIAEFPTRADAEFAVSLLIELLAEFPFVDDISKAVALSMFITPVLRGAMPAAPMHLVTAPEAGTGKSYLADVASMNATGERIAAVAVSPKPDETEKRLVGAALAGYPLIGLDNCHDILEGDLLCQITERPLLQLRALGKSDKIRVNNTFTVLANGNNVAVAGDLVRRTICCALDADMENPETRTFRGDPLATVRRDRGAYIAACLTIARAYIAAGKPNRLPPLASYEAWSDLVRSPLVWLGFADPVSSMVAARAADPIRQERARAFTAWRDEIGLDRDHTAAEIIEQAEACYPEGRRIRPNLYAVLIDAAQKRGVGVTAGQIDPRRLGKWLTKRENTIANGLKLWVDRSDARRPRYGLRVVG
jgi:putative DNA primase/helicase